MVQLKKKVFKKPDFAKNLLALTPLIVFLVAWQLLTGHSERLIFFYGSPLAIFNGLVDKISSGIFFMDLGVTGLETLLGFLIGNIGGTLIGLALWYNKTVFNIARPYIVALGAIPVFALAPLIIIWFGTGLMSKVVMSVISTILVALIQAYNGAMEVDPLQLDLMKSLGATKRQTLIKIVVPSSLSWVVSAFRMNVGLALMGAFIGEFISSEKGLGYLIITSGAVYNIPMVFVGLIGIILLALSLTWIVGKIEKRILVWKFIS